MDKMNYLRVIESLRLEKTSKITQSNATPPHHTHRTHPSVPHPHDSSASPWTVTPPPPWAAVPLHCYSFREEMFPNTQPELPLVQLEAITACFITDYLGEKDNPYLAWSSHQYYTINLASL